MNSVVGTNVVKENTHINILYYNITSSKAEALIYTIFYSFRKPFEFYFSHVHLNIYYFVFDVNFS
jgi:hypothetical protein